MTELATFLSEALDRLGPSGAAVTRSEPTLPISGESGGAVMKRLPQVHSDDLYREQGRFQTFKAISIYYALPEITLPGDFAQFGVFKGFTARLILRQMPTNRILHLFDSFEGLPEDWLGQWTKGAFSLNGKVPDLPADRIVIHKGWFNETVPPFAASIAEDLAFLHLDADLYSSTVDVLYPLDERIAPGTILLFDEYMMNGEDDEHRALIDWANHFGRKFEYLWRTRWMQVAVRVLK